MKLKEIREQSKSFVMVNKYNPLIIYAVILTFVVIFALLGIGLNEFWWFVTIPYAMAYFLYAPVIYSGADFYLKSYNLKFEEYFKLFEGFKKENFFRSLFLHMILTAFAGGYIIALVVGLGVGFGVPGVNGTWLGVGLGFGLAFLFSIPESYFLTRLSMAYYFLKMDQSTSAWDAIKLSWQVTKGKGHTLNLLKLFFSYFGYFALGILTVGLTFIYAMPLYQTAKSIYFRRVLLGIDDDRPVSELADFFKTERDEVLEKEKEAARREKEAQKEAEKGGGNAEAPVKKKRRFSRDLVPDDINIESQVEAIRELIPQSDEVVIPAGYRDDLISKELQIRENETFDEYRTRVQHVRNIRTGKEVPTDEELEALEKELLDAAAAEEARAAFISADEEVVQAIENRIVQKTEARVSTPGKSQPREEVSKTQSQAQEAHKADKVQQSAAQNPVADKKPEPKLPDTDEKQPASPIQSTTAPRDEADLEAHKKAAQEKIAKIRSQALAKTGEQQPVPVTITPSRALNDKRVQDFRSRERPTAAPGQQVQQKLTREEILERLKKERAKKIQEDES